MRGERLKQFRELRHFSQAELAARLGVAANSISRWENGDNDPSGEAIVQLCKELRVSSDYLLGLTDEPNEQMASPGNIEPEILKGLIDVQSENPIRILLGISTMSQFALELVRKILEDDDRALEKDETAILETEITRMKEDVNKKQERIAQAEEAIKIGNLKKARERSVK